MSLAFTVERKFMLDSLCFQSSPLLELNVHLEREVTPANSRQQEGSFIDFYDGGFESRVQVVGHRLDELCSRSLIVVQEHEHRPSMRVLSVLGRSCRLSFRYGNFFMCVTKCEYHRHLTSSPQACFNQLLLLFLELLARNFFNLFLQLGVNQWDKLLVKMVPTHRASHPHREHLLGTLEAEEMFARCRNWLCA